MQMNYQRKKIHDIRKAFNRFSYHDELFEWSMLDEYLELLEYIDSIDKPNDNKFDLDYCNQRRQKAIIECNRNLIKVIELCNDKWKDDKDVYISTVINFIDRLCSDICYVPYKKNLYKTIQQTDDENIPWIIKSIKMNMHNYHGELRFDKVNEYVQLLEDINNVQAPQNTYDLAYCLEKQQQAEDETDYNVKRIAELHNTKYKDDKQIYVTSHMDVMKHLSCKINYIDVDDDHTFFKIPKPEIPLPSTEPPKKRGRKKLVTGA